MAYNKPTIRELYCEFFYHQPIDTKTQLRLVDVFKKDAESIKIDPDVTGSPSNSLNFRIRLWMNKNELVQVFGNRIAFNYVPINSENKKYLGWDYFSGKALDVVSRVEQELNSKDWKYTRLVYLDTFTVPDTEDFTIGKVINCNGEVVPKLIQSSRVATDIIIGNGAFANYDNFQAKIRLYDKEKDLFKFDLESSFAMLSSNEINAHNVLKILHKKNIDFFESIITDYTREEIMGGEV